MDHIRNYNYTDHLILEGNSNLTPAEQRMFARIIKHEDVWLNQFKEMLKETSESKKVGFTEHYNIVKFINEEPAKMRSILGKLSQNKLFHEWFEKHRKDFTSNEFENIISTSVDLKKLGF